VNANSPRRPGPAAAPAQDMTSAVMRWLAVGLVGGQLGQLDGDLL
jgi:hypothetical protein